MSAAGTASDPVVEQIVSGVALDDPAKLLEKLRPFLGQFSKARTAKIVRSLIERVATIADSERVQIALCQECIAWTNETKQSYLRQRLQLTLYGLYRATGQYQEALKGVVTLLREVKRLDDKPLLLEIQLLESRIYHSLMNLPKAKAALTSARTNANAIYCPPKLQAELDLLTGALNADEHDYTTAFSYFFEAFECYITLDAKQKAVAALKYMLLCKIMLGNIEEAHALLNVKSAQHFVGHRIVLAMQAIAKARKERSLHDFTKARDAYKEELVEDPMVRTHLDELYNRLLEQNLCRLIEPFSCVEIEHVASLIDLPLPLVEKRLSQMILDKKIAGILDQGAGQLLLFDEPPHDKTYPFALETMQNVSHIVDNLHEKAVKFVIS
eukprot:TRINITY_DN17161_c0_g1_i1.p1 TRINITY_DN17161_c0_g1~~TRINITY_DN17161_c0_g1_i1.p1  ORF type:complete len:394 (-),score=154.65 TRINITY_DN17161_c0_g1_i1:67-1218(-)